MLPSTSQPLPDSNPARPPSDLPAENLPDGCLDRLLAAAPWLAGVVALVLWAVGAIWFAGTDEPIFGYMGFAWARGDLPYRDAFDVKPPGVFLLWAAVWRFVGGSVIAGRLLGLLIFVASAVLLGLTARRL